MRTPKTRSCRPGIECAVYETSTSYQHRRKPNKLVVKIVQVMIIVRIVSINVTAVATRASASSVKDNYAAYPFPSMKRSLNTDIGSGNKWKKV